jgi:hypothetical protein
MSLLRNTALRPAPRRHMARVVAALGLAAAGLAAACSDAAPTAPPAASAAPDATLLSGGVSGVVTTSGSPESVRPLIRLAPLPAAQTRAWTVGRAGATLSWPEMGLTVVVPADAVPATTTISATALAGYPVAYDFSPDGSNFAVPLRLIQSTRGTNFALLGSPLSVRGAYFKSRAQVDPKGGPSVVDEYQPTGVDPRAGTISVEIRHFSGYLMSTGRAQ